MLKLGMFKFNFQKKKVYNSLPSRNFLTIIQVFEVIVLHMFILLVNQIVDFRIPSTIEKVVCWSFLFILMAAIAMLWQPVARGWKGWVVNGWS